MSSELVNFVIQAQTTKALASGSEKKDFVMSKMAELTHMSPELCSILIDDIVYLLKNKEVQSLFRSGGIACLRCCHK